MSDSQKSQRQKKKIVQQGLRALKNKPGWDVSNFQAKDPMEELHRLDQQVRSKKTYDQSGVCPDCAALRDESGDDTALCDNHLAAAMGF
jgi:hypothetical protein